MLSLGLCSVLLVCVSLVCVGVCICLVCVCVLTLSAQELHVQVSQAAGGRQGQLDHALDGDRVVVQVVEQGSVLVVVRHQPQLRPRAVV